MLSNNRDKEPKDDIIGPKDIIEALLKDSKKFLKILADSSNDPNLNKLIGPTNQNIDEICDYIDKLPERQFFQLLKRVREYLDQLLSHQSQIITLFLTKLR